MSENVVKLADTSQEESEEIKLVPMDEEEETRFIQQNLHPNPGRTGSILTENSD